MPLTKTILTFDLDWESLRSLREALPAWDVESAAGRGGTPTARNWTPTIADLLVIGVCGRRSEALGVCRLLRRQARWAAVPLFVVVPARCPALVSDMLEAGATTCLIQPFHPKEITNRLARACEIEHLGRHTTSLFPAPCQDMWRDEGGEG